ncbi:MAG: hypothetical protein KatS3mg024_1336 [Armatimonadota bacterium]|nr:MAG: hypothetical protein KatS3mg024_1336 [Armatimonadota bacterium]
MGSPVAARLQILDVFRGSAIVLMVAYHFCFDLGYFGHIRADFNHDWRWLSFRAIILSSFLLTAGASLGISAARGLNAHRFLKGLGQVAGAAALVSLGSWLVFPRSWIFFGVLHCIALSRIIGLAFIGRPQAALGTGVAVTIAGHIFHIPALDAPALRWIGMMTFKPLTEDYVPLFPWTGMFLTGMWVGDQLLRSEPMKALRRWESRSTAVQLLAWAGKRSLIIYLLHQPLLFAVFYAVRALRG